jgi:hypothetical protein
VGETLDYLLARELSRIDEGAKAELLKGNVEDWGAYKYLCGKICGIHLAMDALVEARKRANRDGGV